MSRRPSAFSALIAIDKPAGLTSHDVVSRVRRAVGEKRVGHAGTLDPAATGVLVVGIGQATKLLGLLTLDRKGYRATFALGAQTTTDDAEGEVIATADVPDELLDPARAARDRSDPVADSHTSTTQRTFPEFAIAAARFTSETPSLTGPTTIPSSPG